MTDFRTATLGRITLETLSNSSAGWLQVWPRMPSAAKKGSAQIPRQGFQASANQDRATQGRNKLHPVRGCVHALKFQGSRPWPDLCLGLVLHG